LIPDPLHPALVHFPITLAALLPLFAAATAFAIHRRWVARRGWALVVLLQAALAASVWGATLAGENEEEKVKRVVAERHIEEHQELGERLLWLSAAGVVVVAAGLLGGSLGGFARVAGVLATLGVAAASVPVGRSGGELVYHHGAASAYVSSPEPAAGADPRVRAARAPRSRPPPLPP
jgi:uncharacterized membrane protein